MKVALRKKHKILVLGSTGVGKTNFLNSLTSTMPSAIDLMTRTEIAQKHHLAIEKQPFIFIDTPGQFRHKDRRIDAIREAIADGIDGVINVVSFGYHEYRIGKDQVFIENRRVNEDFLQKHRDIEIALIDECRSLLGHQQTAGWLVTVVTKADIWWDRYDTVLNHYESGDYYNGLGEAKNLQPIVLAYCSVFHKFFGEGSLSGQFDDNDRMQHRAHVFSQLLAAVGKSIKR